MDPRVLESLGISIFNDIVRLKDYMRYRKERGLAFPGWRFAGTSSDGKTWFYANRRFDWKAYWNADWPSTQSAL